MSAKRLPRRPRQTFADFESKTISLLEGTVSDFGFIVERLGLDADTSWDDLVEAELRRQRLAGNPVDSENKVTMGEHVVSMDLAFALGIAVGKRFR